MPMPRKTSASGTENRCDARLKSALMTSSPPKVASSSAVARGSAEGMSHHTAAGSGLRGYDLTPIRT